MNLSRWVTRPAAAAAMALAVVVAGWGMPKAGLAVVKQQGEPSQEDLLRGAPFDRITLTDGKSYAIQPVSPRPLPPPKAQAAPAAKKAETKKGDGEVIVPGEAPKDDPKKDEAPPPEDEEDKSQELVIHLLVNRTGGGSLDFKVQRKNIRSIEYFEDMLLAKGDRLMAAKEYSRAFEHYLACKVQNPKWPGIDDRVNRLLFEEGSEALETDRGEQGLLLLRDLEGRKPDYPGLTEKLAGAYAIQIQKAFDAGSFARARRFLHEMEQFSPNAPQVREARQRFIAKARSIADTAPKDEGIERADALAEALRIWPTLEGAPEQFEAAFRAFPTLDVAVADLSHSVVRNVRCPAPWVRTPADARVSKLIYLPILSHDDEAAAQGKDAGQLAAGLDVAALGQRLTLRVKKGIPWADGTRNVSAIDVARTLSDRTDPRSPGYNARWADLLDRIEIADESTLEIRLTRAPLRAESWLLGPVGPAHAAWDGWVTTADAGRQPVGDGPFRWEQSSPNVASYRVLESPSAAAPKGVVPKLRRIRERRLPNTAAALGAFARGEVALLEYVPSDRAKGLAKSKGIKVGTYKHPTMHLIALDARNPVLRDRNLRRGLSYAIDRKALLEETVLKDKADEKDNVVADGPFPVGSYANARDVKPLEFNALLARMLVTAATAEQNLGSIRLKFEYPALPDAQQVAPKVAEAFRKAGVTIDLIERPVAELEEELRAGRRFDLAYRCVRVAEPAFEAGGLICPGYDAPPQADGLAAVASARVLELLLHLEHAPDLPTARDILTRLDRDSRDELPILPLWQVHDHYAWHDRLKGPAEAAETLYQDVDKWEISPWFARDPW
ncbi:MAG TPA: ABC transporter substrate-binding protein [Isosphaeraceae bacterium]|jgi:peptide/nickel transport system substrate-binding protein|nr:ABC transporter substrate-binding protein [Isosphaeraceae bacterium]